MKLKYGILALGLGLVSLSSCNDFLETVPDTRVELVTVKQCRELLVDAYSVYNYGCIEMMTDNVEDNNAPSPTGVRYNLRPYDLTDEELYCFQDVKMGMDEDTPSGIWQGCYGAIACANAVLEAADKIEAKGELNQTEYENLQACRGEAYLVRAFHHFTLCNVFCMPYRGKELSQKELGIPYITSPETTVNPQYDRGTLEDNYINIEKDLQAGLALVTDNFYEQPKYHFNTKAALAFAARFYLYKRDYEKVVQYADSVFGNNDPLTMMQDGWAKKGQFYGGMDASRYWSSIERNCVLLNFSTYSTISRRWGSRFSCNRMAKRCTIQGPGPTWKNCRWTRSHVKDEFNKSFAMHPCFNSYCYYRGDSEYGEFFIGTSGEQFEYTDKLAGIGYPHMIRTEFTCDQLILERAEAKAFLGDIEGCIADLKVWDDAHQQGQTSGSLQQLTGRLIEDFYANDAAAEGFGIVKDIHIDEVCPSDKYHLTPEIAPYIQCCQHYRRIETVHTGARFFDIKRLGLEIVHTYGKDGDKLVLRSLDPRYAIQIPTEVLSAGLQMNPRASEAPEQACVSADMVPVK